MIASLTGDELPLLAAARGGSPLRVCFVSADYPATSPSGIGGIAAHTYALSHAIADLGNDVTVLTECAGKPERFSDGRVSVHAIPRGSQRMWKVGRWVPVPWLRRTLRVWQALRRLHASRAFHFVSFPDGYGEGFRYSFSPLAPYAVQLFGPASFVQRWDGRYVPPVRARMERWMERRPAAHASLLISATRRFARLVADEWGLDPERIRIIRNPLNLTRYRPADPGPARDARRVLFVGHLQPLKGLRALTAAVPLVVAQHPDVEFEFVGNDTKSTPDGGSMRASMERTLRESGALQRVRFVDPVPQLELVGRYQACSVLVLPSLNDVYPNAVLEAMACGRPCVVSETVGTAELVAEARAGRVVPPDDANALAEAISHLLALPEQEREAMGARARQVVERACATPVIAAQTMDAYREVLGRDSSTRALEAESRR